jgi:hypothetical protein
LVVGASNHDYATSGNHITGDLENAGAAYVYDAMLREQIASVPSSGGWIKASLIGDGSLVQLYVEQNTTGTPISYYISGVVASNINGDVFLEASGYDPATRGFITHRPYVEQVIFRTLDGTEIFASLPIVTSGKPFEESESMNLIIPAEDSAFVYNTMNLHTDSWNTLNVGSGNTPLSLTALGTSGIPLSGGLNIVMSGIGLVDTPLNLRVKGK